MGEIEKIIKKIQEGALDKNDLYEYVKDFIDLQRKINLKYTRMNTLSEGELLGLIWLGIEYAVKTYRFDKNCGFLTWASYCVNYCIARDFSRLRFTGVSLDALIDNSLNINIEETISDPTAEEAFVNSDIKSCGQLAMETLKKLPAIEQEIITLCCINNFSVASVAKRLNMSATAVRRLRNTGLAKLNKLLT